MLVPASHECVMVRDAYHTSSWDIRKRFSVGHCLVACHAISLTIRTPYKSVHIGKQIAFHMQIARKEQHNAVILNEAKQLRRMPDTRRKIHISRHQTHFNLHTKAIQQRCFSLYANGKRIWHEYKINPSGGVSLVSVIVDFVRAYNMNFRLLLRTFDQHVVIVVQVDVLRFLPCVVCVCVCGVALKTPHSLCHLLFATYTTTPISLSLFLPTLSTFTRKIVLFVSSIMHAILKPTPEQSKA